MKEQELLEKIRQSSESIHIPESLSPETIGDKLKKIEVKEGRKKFEWEKKQFMGKNKTEVLHRAKGAAAIMVLLGGMGIYGMQSEWNNEPDGVVSIAEYSEDIQNEGSHKEDQIVQNSISGAEETGLEEEEAEHKDIVREKKHNAGDLYTVASNYGEIYDSLEYRNLYYYDAMKLEVSATVEDIASADGGTMEEAGMGMSGSTTLNSGNVSENISGMSEFRGQEESAESESEKEYAKTNLQSEGVDESDIIKTDGSYFYIVDEDCVKIVDVQKKDMKQLQSIDISMNSASDRVVEMYVQNDILNLIVQKESAELKENSKTNTDEKTAQNSNKITSENNLTDQTSYVTENSGISILSGEEIAAEDIEIYYMEENIVTELLTYDISDRTNPVLKGTVTQDGKYWSSRKIGEILYLFTENNMEKPNLTKSEAVLEENAGGWIPVVNGEAVAADCIYIPEQGSEGLLISSVNVQKPDCIVDNTLIINNHVDIYVSTGAMYLYRNDYSGNGISTQIAKFSLEEGVIDAVGAVSAAGSVYDTFAINEYQGKLRLLTTDWSSGQDENNLFLFDKNLRLTGKLTGLAKGEQIYAARYFGDMAYFVTYRNTDPLFAVDLSDEKNPKVLSELKITGFSEYLHFWGKDKLVGIGYETDPDSGAREGIKLTMFDISDPANLKTAGTCVIENLDYAPALYQYKSVLVDESENLVGFAAESYGRESRYSYLLFEWEDGSFEELMTETLARDEAIENYRGVYIDDVFYLVSLNNIASYDRKSHYEMINKLQL